VVFANRYLDAYEKYYKKSECSACWKLAFDTAKTWRPMVIHHLLAGMNAHISLDLGIAAATVSQGKPINDIQNDFNKINTILKELTDNVKSDLFDMWPLSKFLTGLKTDKLENEMAAFSMTIARDAAWQVALNYSALNNDSDKEKFIAERDRKVTEFGKKILYFKFWQSMLATIFRIFETGSISSKIAKLDK
jgi:hypothetical protein